MVKAPTDVCPFHDRCFDALQAQIDRRLDACETEHKDMWAAIKATLPRWVYVSSIPVIVALSFWIVGEMRSLSSGIAQAATNQAVMVRALERLEKQHEVKTP